MPARRAISAAQLEKLLRVLTLFGFKPGRVEVSPEGAVTLLGEQESTIAADPLSMWEARRGARPQ